MSTGAYVLSVGQKTPWRANVGGEDGAGCLVLDAVTPILVITLPRPSRAELRIFAMGDVKFVLCSKQSTGFLIARFSNSVGRPLHIETPFHIGLEAVPSAISIAEHLASGPKSVSIVVQDESHVARVLRVAPLSKVVLEAVSQLIFAQQEDAHVVGFEERHAEMMKQHYAKHKDAAASYLAANAR